MTDRCERARLAQKALSGRGIVLQIRLHYLEGDPSSQAQIFRKKDESHSAFAEQAEHPIVAKAADFIRFNRRIQEAKCGRG